MLLLVAVATAARLAYLAWLCPYTLVEDEAHYWEWSRRPDWSYYSKGPGVAWAIAASNKAWGAAGMADTELAVRTPAVLAAAVFALAAAWLARAVSGSERAAFYAALGTLLAPVFIVSAMLMTIDMPYVACWTLAACGAWAALHRRSRAAWLMLGGALGAGLLFKYTILLLPPGILLYAIAVRARLQPCPAWRRWAAAAAAVFAIFLMPIVIWNAQRGWPTARHLLGHLGMPGGDIPGPRSEWAYDPIWTLELVGSQVPLLGPIILVMALGVLAAVRQRGRASNAGRLFLIACALPILTFYLAVTLVAQAEANWPLAAYATLLALAAWQVDWAMGRAGGMAWATRAAWALAVILGVALSLVASRIDLAAQTALARFTERRLAGHGLVERGRSLIPLGRLMGARKLAADAAAVRDRLRAQTGREPFIIAQQYGRASLLAFYMPGRPTVYCASGVTGGRRTQYDYWPDTDLSDLSLLGSRPALLVGGPREAWEPAFERVREHGVLDAEPKAGRIAWIGLGYRGFAPGPGDGRP